MKNSLSGKTVDEMTGSREALQEAAFPLAFISRLRMATDGAGVTALVGAQGCPLQCRMCHTNLNQLLNFMIQRVWILFLCF